MIIQLDPNISPTELTELLSQVRSLGFKPTEVSTQSAKYVVAIGSGELDIRKLGLTAGVKDIFRVSEDYKLVSRKWKVGGTVLNLGDGVTIGEGALALIAGPCSVESEEQISAIVEHLLKNDIRLMRGGAFKPRTSPYSFRGLGVEGLKIMHTVARSKGIKVVSEVLRTSQIEEMYDYVDVYQVGARNTQNFSLLHELGKVDKPVLLKRGMSGTIEELLQSAEYVFSSGNERLILCERGIRTFENAYRNTLDLNAVPTLKEKTHLPIIVDPSHGIGIRRFVEPMALSAIIAGADGIIYETHPTPEKALSDKDQTLDFEESEALIKKAREVFRLREAQ